MNAPDKIYIFQDGDELWYKPEEWGDTPPPNRVEYIRKDDLLEWAKEQKARLKQGYKKDWKNDDTLNGGKLMLDKLIDKLSSM